MVKLWAEDMFEENTKIIFSLKTGEIVSYNRVEIEPEKEDEPEEEIQDPQQLEMF